MDIATSHTLDIHKNSHYHNACGAIQYWIVAKHMGGQWPRFHIDAFFTSGNYTIVFLMAGTSSDTPFQVNDVLLAPMDHQQLEEHFKILRKEINKQRPCNKIRFTYCRESAQVNLECKWDGDFDWLTSLFPECPDYTLLDISTEIQIMTWPGLPLDYPRPWQEITVH